jgi:RNA polymerase sigma-70 factor, ECF subfamily
VKPVAEKIVNESLARLLSRAENSRLLTVDDLLPRVFKSIEKYLPEGSTVEIREFIETLKIDDLCLIIACEKKDDLAWKELVEKFGTTVKSAARNITKNNEDAEDLASSIWAELHGLRIDASGNSRGKLAYYSGRGSLGGWLRAVVSQLAVDQYRKISRFVQIEESREFENLANENEETLIVPNHATPELLLDEKRTSQDVAKALKSAIESLSAEDKLLIKLYYFDNLNLKKIGEILGFHEATASRKIVKVQSELRKTTEKILQTEHGWKAEEVNRNLSATASKLGFSVEKLFVLFILTIVQEMFR